jgi:uncharacterized repeat protein (TIGR01451 family)
MEILMKLTFLRLFSLPITLSLLITPVSAQPDWDLTESQRSTNNTLNFSANGKIDPVVLDEIHSQGSTDFFIWMVEQADVSQARNLPTKLEKGQFVFDTLVNFAEQSQRDLRALLDAQGADYQSFYIANLILVKGGSQQLLFDIAARPDVDTILPNRQFQLQEPFIDDPNPPETLAVETNITFIRATDVWAMGFTGQGTVMASGDTGLQWDHPAIIDHYRGWNGTTADHNYNWWDATGTYPSVPGDGHGHGTHISGTMVGDDGGANQIGVAPGAQVIHCKNMTDGGSGSDLTFTTCFEWVLAPWDLSGANPLPSMAPDAMNNSWGYFGGGQNQFRTIINNLQAAGILVEVSSGNEGPSCSTLRSPGDYWEVLTTGSVNHASGTLPGTITGFSSRGPSSLDPGDYFPDIMAPGEGIRSSLPGDTYAAWSGTSMAGPHATALVGLMWSANPALTGFVEETIQIIKDTAVPLTGQGGSSCGGDYTDGPNNDWGFGTIDALAAVNSAIDFGGIGTLQGTVTEAGTGDPIPNATIQAVGPFVLDTTTNTSGEYSLIAPQGSYEVTASAYSYFSQTVSGIEIIEAETTIQNFSLTSAPTYLVSGIVTDANTGWPLYARIDIDGYPLGAVWTNPETGDYSVSLAGGQIYNFHVNAWVDGYLATSRAVGPLTGNQVENFQLDVDALSCNALGYQPVYEFFDDFEGGTSNWTMSGLWNAESEADNCGALVAPFPSPVQAAYYGDEANCNYNTGTNTGSLTMVNPVSIPAAGTLLTYWSFEETECGGNCPWDKRFTEVSIDGGTSWTTIGEGQIEGTWHLRVFDLTTYAGDDVHVRFRFNSVDGLSNNYFGWMVDDIGVSTGCEPQLGSLIVGNVYDGNTGDGLVNASVINDMGYTTTSKATPLDPNVDDGFYTLFGPQGTNGLTASKSGYGPDNAVVMAIDGETIRQDFNLTAGFLQADSENLLFDVPMGSSMTVPLDLQNLGTFDVQFEIREIPGGYSPMFSSGHIPKPLERLSGYESLAMTTEGLFVQQTQPTSTDLLAAGDVLNFWSSGHTLSWGTGFSLNEEMVWVNDNQAGGGTGLNEEFAVDGSLTGMNFTPSFGGSWPGDMAYNPNTGLFWQVNVGGDNCIYEWDPTIPDVTGNSICGPGWTGTSQRGLAYNPDVDTFFIGGWNDATVYEIDTSGATVKSCTMNLPISGLAYNWEAGLLFAMLNASPNTIEVIDWASCSVIDSITVAGGAFPTYSGAGMGIDCSGNLWAANQANSNIYLIDSGVPANLCAGVPWLSANPTSGTVPAEDSLLIEVILDASVPEVTQYGLHQATLRFLNNTPYGSLNIPVAMNVVAIAYGVELTTEEDALSAEPGETVDYTLTLTNRGNVPDTFALSIEGNVWVVDLPDEIVLAAGESVMIRIDVTIPANAEDGDSDIVTVTATSTGNASQFASLELTTTAVVPEPDWYFLFTPLVVKN